MTAGMVINIFAVGFAGFALINLIYFTITHRSEVAMKRKHSSGKPVLIVYKCPKCRRVVMYNKRFIYPNEIPVCEEHSVPLVSGFNGGEKYFRRFEPFWR